MYVFCVTLVRDAIVFQTQHNRKKQTIALLQNMYVCNYLNEVISNVKNWRKAHFFRPNNLCFFLALSSFTLFLFIKKPINFISESGREANKKIPKEQKK
jgi:hypothetical protein